MAKAEADGEPPRAHHKTAGVEVSRLVNGLPVGGDLEYAGELTLGRAIEARRALWKPGKAARCGDLGPEKLHETPK